MKIIPLVVGSLGAIPKQFGKRLKQIGITAGTAQKSKSKATGCGSISTVFSSIVLLSLSSVIIPIIVIIINCKYFSPDKSHFQCHVP